MRSTVRIDEDLVIELKARARAEAVSLTHMVNRMLRAGVAGPEVVGPATERFRQETVAMGRRTVGLDKAPALAERPDDSATGKPAWTSRPMRARVDLDDKEVVYAVLDGDDG